MLLMPSPSGFWLRLLPFLIIELFLDTIDPFLDVLREGGKGGACPGGGPGDAMASVGGDVIGDALLSGIEYCLSFSIAVSSLSSGFGGGVGGKEIGICVGDGGATSLMEGGLLRGGVAALSSGLLQRDGGVGAMGES